MNTETWEIPPLTPFLNTRKKLSYQEYRLIPDDGKRHEIIDGEHYMNPAPETYHQTVSRRILVQLYNLIEETGRGVVFYSPIDLQLTEHDIVQPDLLVVLSADLQIITPSKVKGIPALVVEILSPSNRDYDRRFKFDIYERCQVPEYWVVDPEEHVVEQFLMRDGCYQPLGVQGKEISFQGLPDVRVDLSKVW